eukprot:CAMPEP_0184289886 /NCGR_PEP_ID=MMETSP1049-20130417/2259_1 /TAXON_ID=77928 /ORGANISM="Proteomonas sulcata, Strain CCMP704" /LENGTH=341 /DNA_ID=CAMNT_0026596865 /DNA_START=60 /DNA_END=1085 /DNA_ORIENTATION=-
MREMGGDQEEMAKELQMYQGLVKQRELDLQETSRALQKMDAKVAKSEEVARHRQDEIHKVVEENIKLQAEAVAAVTVTADIHPEILHNREERWRMRRNFSQAATGALGVRESRLEVVGIRPGPDPTTIEIDAHILPQTHAQDEPPAITLAQELLTQIAYPKSYLRNNSAIGQRLCHGAFRHEHEFVEFLRQTVLNLDHKIHELKEKKATPPEEANGFAPNLIKALTPEARHSPHASQRSREVDQSPADLSKQLQYESQIERHLEKSTELQNENSNLGKRIHVLEYENVRLLEENDVLKQEFEKMDLEVKRLRGIAFDSTAAADVQLAQRLLNNSHENDILA